MEEFRGTPGPWHGKDVAICRQDSAGLQLGFIMTGSESRAAEGLANAYLIAAAPEMFEALRSLYHAVLTQPSGGTQMSIALEKTRDTLHKALGK